MNIQLGGQMHKVTMPDGTRRTDKWLRVLRILAYFLMGLAGVLLLFSPLLPMLGPGGIAMSWFLGIGGFLSLYGAIRERWIGEYVGLPLLASAFMVFGVIEWAMQFSQAPFIATANLSLLFAVAFTLFGRWREVRAVFKIAATPHGKKEPRDAAGA